jgi:hypothetical protein
MIVAVELRDNDPEQLRSAHATVRRAIEQHLAGQVGGVFDARQPWPDPIVFRARGRKPLGFLFYALADNRAHDFAKQVITASHADDLAALALVRDAGITPLGVMPHWLGSTQQAFGDGSPASLPRPARPPLMGRWRYRYTVSDAGLSFGGQRRNRRAAPVLILDTRPDWRRAQRLAGRLAETNWQLSELLAYLGNTSLPDWHAAALDACDREGLKLARPPDGRARGHEVSDHGLFVSGLIHDLAPGARIELRPVLNRYGVGDFRLLLQVLASVTANRSEQACPEPLIVNMSLGFMPKPEHLPWLWFGVNPPDDPDFVPDVPIRGQPRDRAWLAQHRSEVARTTGLLHVGVERLFAYLLDNNCLGIAAAGNDSLRRAEMGRPRLGPRVPARYETVLGVAATTADPATAAPYSNVGEEFELGDHVSTFGGSITPDDEPLDGVIGVYTAPSFPRGNGRSAAELQNETGWATWSGTSFATAIMSGIVSGYWGAELARDPALRAGEVLLGFHTEAKHRAPGLRTPSVAISGAWERA